MTQIDCPRARSGMTPCVARDGHTACADDGVCVGCGHDPVELLADLAGRYPPAGQALTEVLATGGAVRDATADALTQAVRDYVETL